MIYVYFFLGAGGGVGTLLGVELPVPNVPKGILCEHWVAHCITILAKILMVFDFMIY